MYLYIIVSNYSIFVGVPYCGEYTSILGFKMSVLVSALTGNSAITETLLVRLLYR